MIGNQNSGEPELLSAKRTLAYRNSTTTLRPPAENKSCRADPEECRKREGKDRLMQVVEPRRWHTTLLPSAECDDEERVQADKYQQG